MEISVLMALTDHDALYSYYPTRRALVSTRVVPRVELSRADQRLTNASGRCSFSALQTNLNFLLLSLHNTYPIHQIQSHNAVSSLLYRSSRH